LLLILIRLPVKDQLQAKIHKDQARAWTGFKECCDSVGLVDDYFLEIFSRVQRVRLSLAFAVAMRGAKESGSNDNQKIKTASLRDF
jgi:hypothetical protein